jgi:hypothetical protein
VFSEIPAGRKKSGTGKKSPPTLSIFKKIRQKSIKQEKGKNKYHTRRAPVTP